MTTDYKLWLKYSKTQIAEAWSETKCEKKYMGIKEMNRNKCKLKWVARVMLRRGKRKFVWFERVAILKLNWMKSFRHVTYGKKAIRTKINETNVVIWISQT